jgi:hypothetical protein
MARKVRPASPDVVWRPGHFGLCRADDLPAAQIGRPGDEMGARYG